MKVSKVSIKEASYGRAGHETYTTCDFSPGNEFLSVFWEFQRNKRVTCRLYPGISHAFKEPKGYIGVQVLSVIADVFSCTNSKLCKYLFGVCDQMCYLQGSQLQLKWRFFCQLAAAKYQLMVRKLVLQFQKH